VGVIVRRNRSAQRCSILVAALITSALAVGATVAPATADAASSIGPFVLDGAGSVPAVQVPSSSLISFSTELQGHPTGGGYGGSRFAPKSASVLTITKKFDSTSALLQKVTAEGKHFPSASLSWGNGSISTILCLTDPFATSDQVGGGGGGGGETLQERISFAYTKLTMKTGGKPSCGSASKVPAVQSTLLGVAGHGSSVLARVDCLISRCGGILTLSLPPAACPAGGSGCAFTGGVRVGLNGGGKVHFNGDGSASFADGSRVGLNGSGKFAMGDGSVKVLRLSVPHPLRGWLSRHQHALLGAIIVVRGRGTALVQHDVLDPPAKLPAGAPGETLDGAGPGGGNQPLADLQQSLSLTSCTGTHPVGTPATVVVVSGTLTPPRQGASITLTYTPVLGPPPLPYTTVHTVTTDAAGSFSDTFDRQQGGIPYGWSVVASIAEGGGYAAAQSQSCSIPQP
jgi:type VI protein secretion system component Hcp